MMHPTNNTPFPDRWTARWIWDEGVPRAIPAHHEFRLFRRAFEAASGARLIVHVAADSRYHLYLNGERVSVGPCRGDGWRMHVDTVDLSPWLRPGRNVLAARVLHFRPADPPLLDTIGVTSVWRTAVGGFFLQGSVEGGATLDTNERWKATPDTSVTFHENRGAPMMGETETVDGARFPHGWTNAEYDDVHWLPAVPFWDGLSPERTVNGEFFGPWSLTPRPIPPMDMTNRRFSGVSQSLGEGAAELGAALCGASTPQTLPPGAVCQVDMDAGELTTGYVRLSLSGGRGGVVRLTYAEAYGQGRAGDAAVIKTIRDDPAAGGIHGQWDEYRASDGEQVYETFWFRTFRFVRVEVTVGDDPLTLGPLSYVETGYPLEVESAFEASDPRFARLWDISVRTLRRCMHETYEDCPYYEQLQYAMDTRLEALYHTYLTADDRLLRKAIHDFHSAWHPSGLLLSRAPCVVSQIIPGFSLHWVFMVDDHWRLFGDASVPRRYRSSMDSVLDWFDRHLTPDGLVGGFGFWPYFDWVHGWPSGMPPGAPDQPSTVFSQLYATALRTAAELSGPAGYSHREAEYRQRAEAVNAAVNRLCWDGAHGLYRDGPKTQTLSVHAQVWAILSGAATGDRASILAAACLDDGSLAQMNWAMQFYLFRALRVAGLYHRSFELYHQWSRLADMNVTTWPEDPVTMRSDCHGWGSAPLYEFLAEILGVQPDGPGFSAIRIAPQPGPLQWARGSVATPRGVVQVRWRREGEGLCAEVNGPEGVSLTVEMPDKSVHRGQGRLLCG